MSFRDGALAPDPESGASFWIPGSLSELVIGPAFGRTRLDSGPE
jgi:hypothetical protein